MNLLWRRISHNVLKFLSGTLLILLILPPLLFHYSSWLQVKILTSKTNILTFQNTRLS